MTIHYTNTNNPIEFPKLPKQSTIDRLWGEALDKAVPETYSSLTVAQLEKIKNVFTELIVKECMSLSDELKAEYLRDRKQETDFSVKNIYAEGEAACDTLKSRMKKHFGVKR